MTAESAATRPLTLEMFIEEIEDLARKLGATEAEITILETRVSELERRLWVFSEVSRAAAGIVPASTSSEGAIVPPQVAPLIARQRASISTEFFSTSEQVERPPIQFQLIAKSFRDERFAPIPVITAEERIKVLRDLQHRTERKASYTWQEVATIALPILFVVATLVGAVRLLRPDDSGSNAGLASPTVPSVAANSATLALPSTPTIGGVLNQSPPAGASATAHQLLPTIQPTTQVPASPSTAPTRAQAPTPSIASTASTENAVPAVATQVPTPLAVTTTGSPSSATSTVTTQSFSASPTATSTPETASSTEESSPAATATEATEPVAPIPGGVGSTSADIEQTFGALESVTPDGDSVYQGASVLVRYSSNSRAWRVSFELAVDTLVFDRAAADGLADFYRPPGAQLLTRESPGPGIERLTYATPGLAAYLSGEDTSGHNPGVYVEEFHTDPETGRVTELVTEIGPPQ